MKKIALINPPFREVKHTIRDAFPLGLGYIKAYCESKGVACDLFDFSCTKLNDEELVQKYGLNDYEIIGISTYSLFFSDTVNLINILKRKSNCIVVGGHHASLCGKKLLEDFPNIDFCLMGFGEKSFYDFVCKLDTDDIYSVMGLCYRKNKQCFENSINYNGININEFPIPDRSDIYVDAANYEYDATNEVIHISTSRGCPYRCTYCVNCKNNYWLVRDEENVIDELHREFTKGDFKYINFVDCNFYVNPDRAEHLIERIRSEFPGVKFSFQTRSDQVVQNMVRLKKLLSKGDCNITLGIESNSKTVLERYKKGTSPEINQKAIDFLKHTQGQIIVYMIMFEALESLEDIRLSFDFIKNNDLLDYSMVGNIYQTLVPFYGSAYYDEFHDYYTGSIHQRTHPKFVDRRVQKLYDAVCDFRNEYEDRIASAIFGLLNKTRTDLENEYLFFLTRIQYIVFEYLLVVCETYKICELALLDGTDFKTSLDCILKYTEEKLNENNDVY